MTVGCIISDYLYSRGLASGLKFFSHPWPPNFSCWNYS